AFASVGGVPVRILRTRIEPARAGATAAAVLYCEGSRCYADCASGGRLRLLAFDLGGRPAGAAELQARFGSKPVNFD
ncbi:MAG: hypothetical protein WCA17_16110, partial [Burkholderiales bacterium]